MSPSGLFVLRLLPVEVARLCNRPTGQNPTLERGVVVCPVLGSCGGCRENANRVVFSILPARKRGTGTSRVGAGPVWRRRALANDDLVCAGRSASTGMVLVLHAPGAICVYHC